MSDGEVFDDYVEPPMRTEAEILTALEDAHDLVWLARARRLLMDGDAASYGGLQSVTDRMIERGGEVALRVLDPFEYSRLEGRLEALRWVLGDGWGNFDT